MAETASLISCTYPTTATKNACFFFHYTDKGNHFFSLEEKYGNEINCQVLVALFRNEKYKLTDIPFTALDCSFIEKYDLHLRTDCHLALGTIVHLTTSYRTIIHEAVADGILTFNPFWGYEPERPQREQKYLTADELELMMTTPLHNARLYSDVNLSLKKIAAICDIERRIVFHAWRHNGLYFTLKTSDLRDFNFR